MARAALQSTCMRVLVLCGNDISEAGERAVLPLVEERPERQSQGGGGGACGWHAKCGDPSPISGAILKETLWPLTLASLGVNGVLAYSVESAKQRARKKSRAA